MGALLLVAMACVTVIAFALPKVRLRMGNKPEVDETAIDTWRQFKK
jgi:hypothetical protein